MFRLRRGALMYIGVLLLAWGSFLWRVARASDSGAAGLFDFRFFEEQLFDTWVHAFRRGPPGSHEYAFLSTGTNGTLLGSADVLITAFACGRLDDLPVASKQAWASSINRFQREDGWFPWIPGPLPWAEDDIGKWASAGTTVEALVLLGIGATPDRPIRELITLVEGSGTADDERRWAAFLQSNVLDAADVWKNAAATETPVSVVKELGQAAGSPFSKFYFSWLGAHANRTDGYWYNHAHANSQLNAMASAFHMLHNYECFALPWPNPRGSVDAALKLQLASGLWGEAPSTCLDLDGVYIAIRGARQAGYYRWSDVRTMCKRYLHWAQAHLNNMSYFLAEYTPHTHLLHGPLFAVAECQEAFPELAIRTLRPWRRSRRACWYAATAKVPVDARVSYFA